MTRQKSYGFAKHGNESFPKKEKEMSNYLVKKSASVGGVAFIEGQMIILTRKENVDVKDGDRYLAVSVFIPEESIKLAVRAGVLAELSE